MLTRNRLFYLLKVDILTLVLVENLLVLFLFTLMLVIVGIVRLIRLVCIAFSAALMLRTPF